MKAFVPFSVYRPNDYRIPRSRKECYGWEVPLYLPERADHARLIGWCLWIVCLSLLVWRTYGWL